MNREMMRASKKLGRKMMKQAPGEFEEIPFHEITQKFHEKAYRIPSRAWKNNHYTVQLYRADRYVFNKICDKIMIRRNDGEPITEWHALQLIKNKITGNETSAVQVFPPESELIDVANMYWLFVETGSL